MQQFPTETAVSALRSIFWGGLLCIFDFSFTQTTNGDGFKFDVISDAVGCWMIARGVAHLRNLLPVTHYVNAMNYVQVIAWICFVDAMADHVVLAKPLVPSSIRNLFSLSSLVAIVAFSVSMRWLCESLVLSHAARSWRTTTWLFVFIYLVPLGLFHAAAIMATITGQRFQLNLGPAGLLLLLVFVVPLIHLFVSTSRMKEELESMHS